MATSPNPTEMTHLLNQARNGRDEAVNRLYKLVYDELRLLARNQLKSSDSDTLNTTALVHEAYLKMFNHTEVEFKNRTHFFALSARVMRQIIIDMFRMKQAKKRGGEGKDIAFEEVHSQEETRIEQLLTINLALEKIFRLDERMGRVVECKFFAGMEEKEIAACLDVSIRTVRYDWQKARMWLARELMDQ